MLQRSPNMKSSCARFRPSWLDMGGGEPVSAQSTNSQHVDDVRHIRASRDALHSVIILFVRAYGVPVVCVLS